MHLCLRAKLSHTSSPEAVAIVRTSEKSTTERDAAALQASSAHMSTSSVSDHDTIAANNVVVIEITSDDDGEDISTASKLKPTTAAATIS